MVGTDSDLIALTKCEMQRCDRISADVSITADVRFFFHLSHRGTATTLSDQWGKNIWPMNDKKF